MEETMPTEVMGLDRQDFQADPWSDNAHRGSSLETIKSIQDW